MPANEGSRTKNPTEIAHELAEASSRLEGIDPMDFPEYVELRTRVIAGEITSEEACDLLLARYTAKAKAASLS